MGPILDTIVAHKRTEVAKAKERRPLATVIAQAEGGAPARGFAAALKRPGLSVIAEFKRASPSKGSFRAGADPAAAAAIYERHGASALSVLTDERFFAGRLEDLVRARAAVSLPTLRKEFIIDAYQIYEAAAAGADAVLLIAAVLAPPALAEFIRLARTLGRDALVEVHDAVELDAAIAAGADLIGINNRNLRTFETRLETTLTLLPKVPTGCTVVSESGIRSGADARLLAEAGAHAILVGEALMTSQDPGSRLMELVACAPG